jgi:hypothetical protein
MAAIAIVDTNKITEAQRWDAESYHPDLHRLERAIGDRAPLGSVAQVSHPAEIPRVYTGDETGVPFMLAANIRPILLGLSSVSRIPSDVAKQLPANRLEQDDVLVTRTGANHGVACVYLDKPGKFYTSGEGLIVRAHAIDGAYLGAFLGCQYGHRLCQKAVYGSGQPHIAPSYLRKVPVLRLGKKEKLMTLCRSMPKLKPKCSPNSDCTSLWVQTRGHFGTLKATQPSNLPVDAMRGFSLRVRSLYTVFSQRKSARSVT